MNFTLRSKLVALSALLMVAGCKEKDTTGAAAVGTKPSVPAAQAAAENPDQIVARYAGKEIRLRDVDSMLGEQLKELEKKKFQMRQQGAEQMAMQAMVREAALKAGKGEEEWLKERIDAKLPAPSEADIAKVFAENKAKMPPGSTIEAMRPSIIEFLTQEPKRDLARATFDELKTNAKFEMVLQEPKVQVEAIGPSKGPADAKVTIVEFSDFECPFCSRAEPSVDEVMKKYEGKVRVVFRHFPLSFHSHAAKAAEAAACAEAQGKFWEFHKVLFANQDKLDLEQLKGHAKGLGLDTGKFDTCLESGAMKAKVDADQAAGAAVGVNGTPAFFINGKGLTGAQPASEFAKLIDPELK